MLKDIAWFIIVYNQSARLQEVSLTDSRYGLRRDRAEHQVASDCRGSDSTKVDCLRDSATQWRLKTIYLVLYSGMATNSYLVMAAMGGAIPVH